MLAGEMTTTYTTKNKPEKDDLKATTGVMSSDRRHSSETGDIHLDNRALIHRPFILMEELLEKLKLVKYDADFCHAFRYRPISRCYLSYACVSSNKLRQIGI